MKRQHNDNEYVIDSGTTIGHVHLKVSDLERSLVFYRDVLGFEITHRMGSTAAFLSAGGYHHHIGLNTWESAGGKSPMQGTTGLYHFAILVASRRALAEVVQRLAQCDWPLDGAADHGVSEAVYLRDPDGNGIEIYRDRPRDQWPKSENGQISMYTHPLDFDMLLQELNR